MRKRRFYKYPEIKFHYNFPVSSHVTCPVRSFTSRYIWGGVPPAPSPPPVPQADKTDFVDTAGQSSIQKPQITALVRIDALGQRPQFIRHEAWGKQQSFFQLEISHPPFFALIRGQYRTQNKLGFRKRLQQLYAHTQLRARFSKQNIAAGSALRQRQVVLACPPEWTRLQRFFQRQYRLYHWESAAACDPVYRSYGR